MSLRLRPLLAFSLLSALCPALIGPARAADLLVYDDLLRNDFEDWSFAAHDLAATEYVRTGSTSISFEPGAWDGIFFHRDAGMDPAELDSLELWIHGGAEGGQEDLRIALLVNDSDVVNTDLLPFVPGGNIGSEWKHVVIRFDEVGVDEVMDGFWIQAWTDVDQSTLWIDDINYVARDGSCLPGVTQGLEVTPESGLLRLSWTPASLADVHVVRSDDTLPGTFESVEATGDPGLLIPMPPDPLRFYLVAGSNACGEGDLRDEGP